MTARALGAAAIFLAVAAPVLAHQRSLSFSRWRLDAGGAEIEVRLSALDLSRLPLDPADAAAYVTAHLQLLADGVPCRVADGPHPRPADVGWAAWAWRVECPPDAALTLESGLFLDVAPSHLHFARVVRPGGEAVERMLSEAEPRWALAAAGTGASGGTSFPGYVALGIEHIVTGWDHLAFVLALLLLAGTLGEVAWLVSGFTVAHSVTLALAVLGLVRPDAAAVEALIGFSIALVATENAWLLAGRGQAVPVAVTAGLAGLALLAVAGVGILGPLTLVGLALFSACHFALLSRVAHPPRLRAAVAFAFGLVHGFGFAGILLGMELPPGRLVPALVGFNLGVEAGQLAVVALVWPLHRRLARAGEARWVEAAAGSAAIAGLGLYWFVTRAFG